MNIYRKKRTKLSTGREKLVLDVRPICHAKGITTIYSYLKKRVGLPATLCTQLSTGRAVRLTNGNMEAICIALNCTPNELYHYTTPPTETIGATHALAALYRPTTAAANILKKLEKMNPQELERFYEGMEKE